MKIKILLFIVLTLASNTAQAKEKPVPQNNHSNGNPVMPAVGSSEMNGYEDAKKAIAEASREKSAKDKVNEVVQDIVNALRSEPEPREAPKNRLDLSGWFSSTQYITDSTLTASFFYDEPSQKNPYDKVIVVYDAKRPHKPLSATGYKITSLGSLPDLSSMVLVSSAVRSDGTLSNERYRSEPNASGAFTLISIDYDESEQVASITSLYNQPLNMKHLKLRKLFKQTFQN